MEKVLFRVEDNSKNKLNGLHIGYCCFSEVKNSVSNPSVDEALDSATREISGRFASTSDIANDTVVKGIRIIFSAVGIDPTKERPSGEALIRRIVDKKGLYRINSVVDSNNVVSLLTGCPCGVYDLSKITGSTITVKVGTNGDSYEGISGKRVNVENRIVTGDNGGLFGGPTADSKRTCVTPATSEVLMLIYCPSNSQEVLSKAMKDATALLMKATGAKLEYEGVLKIDK